MADFLAEPFLSSPTVLAVVHVDRGGGFRGGNLQRWLEGSTLARVEVAGAAAIAIVSVVALKFLFMDAPLLKIEDLVTSGDDACWALVARPDTKDRKPQSCSEIQFAEGAEAWVWTEAGEIVCSRVPLAIASGLPAPIAKSQACQQTIDDNKAALADEFLCNLLS